MSYSVDNETKIATYNGVEYTPKCVKTVGSEPILVALTEEECQQEKLKTDELPVYALQRLRDKRDALLKETDWIVIKARENNATVPSAWQTYRQALRDITNTYQSMEDEGFSFPEKPTE